MRVWMGETYAQAEQMGVKIGDICTAIAGLQNSELDTDTRTCMKTHSYVDSTDVSQ